MSQPSDARDLDRAVEGAARAHQTLLARLDELTDPQARQLSLLPGWTVGHVVTHLARNADGLRAMIEGAARGEQAEMYPGGAERRVADIEAGAHRPAEALVDDVRMSSWRLEQSWAGLSADAWAMSGIALNGLRPIADIPHLRRREVEVHHADLGLGYTYHDWPADFVRTDLRLMGMRWAAHRSLGLTVLPDEVRQVDDRLRLAWFLGRAEIDGAAQAGLMV